MANFFKEYHAELRAKRQAEAEQERKVREKRQEKQSYIDRLKKMLTQSAMGHQICL